MKLSSQKGIAKFHNQI